MLHNLHNPKMYPYTKFELNVCNRSRDNERKPIMEWLSDGMTKGNTICPQPFHGGGIKIFSVFLLFCYYLPLGKGVPPSFEQIRVPSP
jgi:hypothetical protein